MKCQICGKTLKIVTNTHLKKHAISLSQYKKLYSGERVGFSIIPQLLNKNDLRYKRWRASLKHRPPPWNKGLDKSTHPSIKKTSQTMERKKLDNFKKWREEARQRGIIKTDYPPLTKNESLAELIGLILGDGNIYRHERTERLLISFNKRYPRIVERARALLLEVFRKYPSEKTYNKQNVTRLWLYEKAISKRLGIPAGAKKKHRLTVPEWVWKDKNFLLHCLIGLYNAEGSYSIHLPTYTYNFQFRNLNQSLLKDVHKALRLLEYNPRLRKTCVCLRRKKETERFARQIRFKFYRSW